MRKIITLTLFFFILMEIVLGITIVKELTYNKYTLPVEYKYLKENRSFQFEKMADKLQKLDNMEIERLKDNKKFGVLRNYKNINGRPPKAVISDTDKHGVDRDQFGNIRYQGIPLYTSEEEPSPLRYGIDGEIVLVLETGEKWARIKFMELQGEWYVPLNYLKVLDTDQFEKVVFIDRKNQNITTMDIDEVSLKWKVRSLNPVTTGMNKPPHYFITPLGAYVFQEKQERMQYLKDGSMDEIEGFAPYASRFTGGVYVHGIPINLPKTGSEEYAEYLGTVPRSHKCIRTATSHARFIYNWGSIYKTMVFVIE